MNDNDHILIDGDDARCAVCDNRADFCLGHGSIGDLHGYVARCLHDADIHNHCHANAECRQEQEEHDGIYSVYFWMLDVLRGEYQVFYTPHDLDLDGANYVAKEMLMSGANRAEVWMRLQSQQSRRVATLSRHDTITPKEGTRMTNPTLVGTFTALRNTDKPNPQGRKCSVAKFIASIAPDDAKVIAKVIDDPKVSAVRLQAAFTAVGNPISTAALRRHRRRGSADGCRCPKAKQ